MRILLLGTLCWLLASCATHSQSRWALMGVAAPVGASVGALSAPPGEKPKFHALTWGAVLTAIAALIGEYYYSDDEELRRLRSEVKALKNPPKLELITEGKGYFKDPLSENKEPVKWKVYKMDKWISDGEDTKYHQDMMIQKIKIEKENRERTDEKDETRQSF